MTIQYDDPQLQAWVDAVRNSGVKNSMNKFTGDGVKTVYDINFAGGYLYKADIRAYKVSPASAKADVTITAVDGNRVTLSAPVDAGWTLVIYRDTPKNSPLVDFSDNSIVNERNLDTNFQQAIFSVAEMLDRFDDTVQFTLDAYTAAENARVSATNALASEQAAAGSSASAAASAATASAAAGNAAASQAVAAASEAQSATNSVAATTAAAAASTAASSAGASATLATSKAAAAAASAAAADASALLAQNTGGVAWLPAGLAAPVVFAAGITTASETTVIHAGAVYAAKPELVPFTTTGTFNSAQWSRVYGVSSDSLGRTGITSANLLLSNFNAAGIADGSWIHFAGRDTVGDGGGGWFWYSASSTQTADGGLVFAPAGGGRIFRQGWTVLGFNGAVNIKWFGAKCDGATVDTTAVQAASNAANNVYIPAGVCLVGIVNLRANLTIFGDGRTSIIKQGDGVTGSRGSLYANSGSASAQLENIVIRDLQVQGQVATKGFSEFVHLVSLNGVKNVLVERVHFAGFQGDGLYLGSGINGGDERHNRDIKVVDCTWDGINNQNRNGLSVIDVDNLVVLNPQFANCTRPNMPGCIDMEPDGNAFAVMRNIYIHNVVTTNCGGNVGHVCVFTRAAVLAGASYPLNITIDGVWVYSPKASQGIPVCVITGIDHNEATEANDVTIKNVVAYNGTIPYDVRGVKKLTIEDSTFVDFTNTANLGYFGVGGANYDVTHRGNTYVRCGSNFGNTGVGVFTVRRMHSIDNIYRDCGLTGGTSGVAMNFDNGTSSGVTIEGEAYLSTGRMLTAIGKEASHTFSPATNRYVGNKRGALQNNFQAFLTDDAGVTVNVYDGNTVPTAFPMGTSTTIVNGASGIPAGYSQGVLKTERYTDTPGYVGWITQYFIPRNTAPVALNEMYWRKSNSDDTGWSSWVKVVAS